MNEIGDRSGTWRGYQKRLHRRARRKYYLTRLPFLGLCGGACFLALAIILHGGSWIFAHLEQEDQSPLLMSKKEDRRPEGLSREKLAHLLQGLHPNLLPIDERYAFEYNGTRLNIKTSIDQALQEYVDKLLKRSMTHEAAVVVLRPDNGQILAMVNYQNGRKGERENLCVRADFPAASLFKIVAASAAIEAKGLTPETPLSFRGQKYTLYRSQIKEKEPKGRYVMKTTLREAFSGSINPVFGILGVYELGSTIMVDYAGKYLFNKSIPFDLPTAESSISVPEDDFGLAEIASGFNKRTLISPLHAALMTAAIANKGIIMEPWLVDIVEDASGKIVYQMSPTELASPVSEKTARDMRILMAETVASGTCRSAFRALRRKKAFKGVELGAKTGTINDEMDRYKYDWLIAYASPANGDRGIALAILAVHGEKLGIRAKDLARYILDYHFHI